MPFSKLDKAWSNLAEYYNSTTKDGAFAGKGNVTYTQKPTFPSLRYSSFDDGLIRGGVLNAGLATLRDTARIGKFFASGKGGLFIIKQIGLQLSNPPLEQPPTKPLLLTKNQGFLNNISNSITNFINSKSPTQIYNLGINTLAQVAINSAGGHIIRHGKTPVGGIGFLGGDSSTVQGYSYEKIAKENNILQGDVRADGRSGYSNSEYFGKNPNRLMNYLSVISNTDSGVVNLLEYNGGASSVYGIGKTRINTSSIRTTIGKSILTPGFEKNLNGFKPLTNNEILLSPQANLNNTLENQLNNSPLSTNNTSSFSGYNIENRVGVSTKTNLDSISVINIIDSKTFYNTNKNKNNSDIPKLSSSGSLSSTDVANSKFGNDIVKFRIEFLNNEQSNISPGIVNTDVLAFRAYIDDFQDGMSAKWNPYRYMGRGEDFYVYDGFTRDISVAFTLFAHSKEEMAPIYRKLNYLMSSFAPDYSDYNKMRGNIGYLTVGDYLYRQPGVFTDIKLSGMLDTHWEINLDGDQYELPKHIKVNMSFKPIHTFLPRKQRKGITPSFITPDKTAYKEYTGGENKYLD